MKGKIVAGLLLFMLVSCGQNKNESQSFYYGFTNNSWETGQTVSFPFGVSDTTLHYNVHGKLRYTNSFTFSTLDMSVSLLTPSGSSRFRKIHLRMTSNDGEKVGNSVDDYLEIPFDVYDSVRFAETGEWVLKFNHNMPVDINRGIVGMEIFIDSRK